MSQIEQHKFFLEYLSATSNKQQNQMLLKYIDRYQEKVLQEIASDILQEVIPLNTGQYKTLLPHKTFIRALARGKVSRNLLSKKLNVVISLAKIGLGHHASSKVSSRPTHRVGKNKRKKFRQEASSDSQISCSDQSSEESSGGYSEIEGRRTVRSESPGSTQSEISEESEGFGDSTTSKGGIRH